MTREEINQDIHEEIDDLEEREEKKRLFKKIAIILVIIFVLGFIFFLYTTFISTSSIIVNEERLTYKNLNQEYNGLKIIHFTDFKYGTTTTIKDLEKLVNIINDRNPDLVFYTGDLISKNTKLNSKETENIIKQLRNINSRLGKYAIIGDEDKDNYNTIMNESGFNILNNSYDLIYDNNTNPILVTGTSSLIKKKNDIKKTLSYYDVENHNSDIFSISLVHEADTVTDLINTRKSNIYLAGHSANKTIRLPIFGKILGYKGNNKYKNNYYKIDDAELFISSGIGSDSHIRLFYRPSINFFRISNK